MARKKKQLPGMLAREALVHFSCPSCKKWWSISGASIKRSQWWCPWCGKKNAFAEK